MRSKRMCRPAMPVAVLAAMIVAVVLVVTSGPAHALEQAGSVVAVRGKVEVERQGKRSRLRVKDPIYVVDTIYTNNGRVQLMFTDHSLVSLGRNTVMTVSEYRYQPQAGDGALKTRVTEGVFRVVGGAITKIAPQNFATETPTATIGIRGSMYSGIYRNQVLAVLFEGGRGIYVANKFGRIDLATPNLMTTVPPGEPPTPPKKATPADLQQFYKELTGPVTGEEEGQPTEGREQAEQKDEDRQDGSQAAGAGEGGETGDGEQATQQEEQGGEQQVAAAGPAEKPADQPEEREDVGAAGDTALDILADEEPLAPSGTDAAGLPEREQSGLLEATDTGTDAVDQLVDTLQEVVTSVVTDATREQTATTLEDTVANGETAVLPQATGAFLALFDADITDPSIPRRTWAGTTVLIDEGGDRFSGVETATDGTSWILAFDESDGMTSDAPWGWEASFSRSLTVDGTPVGLSDGYVFFTADHQFHAWGDTAAGDTVTSTSPIMWFVETGFAGVPTSSPPAAGVSAYEGFVSVLPEYTDGVTPWFDGTTGWFWLDHTTGAVLGIARGSWDGALLDFGFLYGHASSAGLDGLSFLGFGERLEDGLELRYLPATGVGSLYATDGIGLGWAGSGDLTSALDSTTVGTAHLLVTAGRVDSPAITRSGGTFRGFMAGSMEEWNATTGTLGLLNAAWDAGDLTITPATDGTISGSLYIQDLQDSGIDSINLVDGVAIGDDIFFGVTDPFPNGAVGVLFTELPEEQTFLGAIWGRMVLPYPTGEGFWIASSRPDLDVLRITAGITSVHALFSGPALALHTDPAADVFDEELYGTVDFDFDLGANTFTGLLDFSGVAGGPQLTTDGSLVGARFTSSSISDANGSFWDAGLWGRLTGTDSSDAGLLGSFFAKRWGDTGELYTGIFGGTLTSVASPSTAVEQTGTFLSVLFNFDDGSLQEGWFGDVLLTDAGGDIYSGTMTDSATGASRSLSLDESGGQMDTPVLGFATATEADLNRTVSLLGVDRVLSPDQAVFDYQNHAFRYFGGLSEFVDGGVSYGYSDFGYAGVPTVDLPVSGGGVYTTEAAGLLRYTDGRPVGGIYASGTTWINFDTGKVLAHLSGYDPLGGVRGDLPLEDAFLFGTLTGNDFSTLQFVAGGDDTLFLFQPPTGHLFLDSAQGLGFAVEGEVDDFASGSPVGAYQMVAAGSGNVTSAPWPLHDRTLTGVVKGIQEYYYADGSLEAVDVDYDDIGLTIGITAGGGVSVETTLTGLLDWDWLNVSATDGVAVSDGVFAAVLDNGAPSTTGWKPPGVLYTDNPPFLGVPPLSSLDIDQTATWGRILLPGEDPADEVEALWAATSLPRQDMTALSPTGRGLFQGKVMALHTDPGAGVFGEWWPGIVSILVDFASSEWRADVILGTVTEGPHLTALGRLDSSGSLYAYSYVTVDGSIPYDRELAGDFFGNTGLDLLLGSFYTMSSYGYQPEIHTGVFVAESADTGPSSGRVLLGGSYLGGAAADYAIGPAVAVNDGGKVWGWVSSYPVIPLDFTMPAPASGTWSELVEDPYWHTEQFWNSESFAGEWHASSLGDFAYWVVPPSIYTSTTTGASGDFQMFTVLGIQPAALPADGISVYQGAMLAMYTDSSGSAPPWAALLPPFSVMANWHAGKVLGVIEPAPTDLLAPLERIFFLADIDATNLDAPLVNVTLLGSTASPFTTAIDVVGLESGGGRFYGTDTQGFGLWGMGSFFDLATDLSSAEATFSALGAGMRTTTKTAATGTAVFEGFVTGPAEDMADIGTNRQEFMNSDPSQFAFTVDRDAGTITGSLAATDRAAVTAGSASLSLEVGAPHASAFIDDQVFAAEIGDSTGAGVTVNGVSGTLKGGASANYLVPAKAADQPATYATWGYWEAAWQDPSSGADYHLHLPGSYWVAGERTPASAVQNLIDTGVVAIYQGRAEGVRIDTANPSNTLQKLPTGTLDLTIDFSRTTVADAVTGQIAFPADTAIGFAGKTLPIGSAASTLTTGGFTAVVTDAASSEINGAFYGPNADSVGGNFRADYTGERYLGIFVGDKQ